jgi:hypothetical protein
MVRTAVVLGLEVHDRVDVLASALAAAVVHERQRRPLERSADAALVGAKLR